MNSKDLKVFCVNHVLNDVPMSIWERAFEKYKSLQENMGKYFIHTNIDISTPTYASVEEYRKAELDGAYTSNGKINTHHVTRLSKKRDKTTGAWVRTFCILLLPDNDLVVTTDPTDTHVVSVAYKPIRGLE